MFDPSRLFYCEHIKMRMERKCFIAISAYSIALCGQVHATTNVVKNMTLIGGQTSNEGRVEYIRSDDSTWATACGNGFGYKEASVICRQLGYPGVNNIIIQDDQWPFVKPISIAQQKLECHGEEENLSQCSLTSLGSYCSVATGVICYENGYIGCYPSSALALGGLQTPCEYGFDDSHNFTIANCVSLCNNISSTYTYAGLYRGDMCFCGSASSTNSKSEMEFNDCSAPCAGRNTERCGGNMHIALFNITQFLLNTNWIAGPLRCEESTLVPTEGDAITTTVSHASSSSSTHSSIPSTSHTMTEGTKSMTVQTSRGMTSDMRSRSRSPTDLPGRTTREPTIELTDVPSSLGLYIGVSAGGGILVLIIIILVIVFIMRWRRKASARTGMNEPDPYMDLQPRPREDRTYQEMAITSLASSPKTGGHLTSLDLLYENQNAEDYASKIKESVHYENVNN